MIEPACSKIELISSVVFKSRPFLGACLGSAGIGSWAFRADWLLAMSGSISKKESRVGEGRDGGFSCGALT